MVVYHNILQYVNNCNYNIVLFSENVYNIVLCSESVYNIVLCSESALEIYMWLGLSESVRYEVYNIYITVAML